MNEIKISKKLKINKNSKQLIVAEVSANHCGSKKKAYDLCIILAGTNDISDDDGSIAITADILRLHAIARAHGCNTIALTIPRIKFERVDNTITKLREKINNNLINNARLLKNSLHYLKTYNLY